jgi:DNA polymerase-3 subunit beta
MATGLRLTLHGNDLTVTGSDPDLTISSDVVVNGGDDGEVAVPPRLVTDIVKSFDDGAVELVSEAETLTIKSGRAEFSVRMLTDRFDLSPPLPKHTVAIPAVPFAAGLRQVIRAALKDDSRAPQLTGVFIVPTDNGLRLIATDSYRLAIRDIEGLTGLDGNDGVLIPARALAEVQRLISDGDSTVEFGKAEFDATFITGTTALTTRLLRGQFPDVERLIPVSYPNTFTTDRLELLTALKRVRTMVQNAKDVTTPVRCSFTSEGVQLTAVVPETGSVSDSVPGTFDGTDTLVAFNPTYLIDGLDAITTDAVQFKTVDDHKPATVTGDDGYVYVIMPVKTT